MSKYYSQGYIILSYMQTVYAIFEIDTTNGSYVEETLFALLLCFKAVYTAESDKYHHTVKQPPPKKGLKRNRLI